MDRIRRAPLVCFDNDGTLFASHEVANPAIQRRFVIFCREHGVDLPAPSDEEICRLTGQPGPEFYHAILPEPLRHLSARFREACLEEEAAEVLRRGRLYPGIRELLADLRAAGRLLVLVTNGGERYIGAVRERVGLDRLLDGVYHHGMRGWSRKAAMIRAAMEDLEAPDAVMVGDRASDLEAAREVGIPFVGCLYGYGTPEELEGADLIVSDPPALRTALLDGTPGQGTGV
jgi:HAD superfamily hydrolase (TIGR01549 family)